MRHASVAALLLVAFTACGDEPLPTEHVTLDSLTFDVPAEWHRRDENRQGVAISEWQPTENERKESVTVIRTTTSPAVAKVGGTAVTQLLAQAQTSLPRAQLSRMNTFTTATGLSGTRISVDFVPARSKGTYHRIHAVIVDGHGGLVHVSCAPRS